jgi:hypothetical protein
MERVMFSPILAERRRIVAQGEWGSGVNAISLGGDRLIHPWMSTKQGGTSRLGPTFFHSLSNTTRGLTLHPRAK